MKKKKAVMGRFTRLGSFGRRRRRRRPWEVDGEEDGLEEDFLEEDEEDEGEGEGEEEEDFPA